MVAKLVEEYKLPIPPRDDHRNISIDIFDETAESLSLVTAFVIDKEESATASWSDHRWFNRHFQSVSCIPTNVCLAAADDPPRRASVLPTWRKLYAQSLSLWQDGAMTILRLIRNTLVAVVVLAALTTVSANAKQITLTDQESGQRVNLAEGDELLLRLSEDHEGSWKIPAVPPGLGYLVQYGFRSYETPSYELKSTFLFEMHSQIPEGECHDLYMYRKHQGVRGVTGTFLVHVCGARREEPRFEKVVFASEKDNGATIHVFPGQSLQISLPDGSRNASNNCQAIWQLTTSLPTGLSLIQETHVRSPPLFPRLHASFSAQFRFAVDEQEGCQPLSFYLDVDGKPESRKEFKVEICGYAPEGDRTTKKAKPN